MENEPFCRTPSSLGTLDCAHSPFGSIYYSIMDRKAQFLAETEDLIEQIFADLDELRES